MGAVNASLAYNLQLSCKESAKCTQCLWSREYHVLPGGSAFPPGGGGVSPAFPTPSDPRPLPPLRTNRSARPR